MRRTLAVAASAAAIVALLPSPASAHGLGGRLDLPVPLWLFVWGAATVVVVSFVALGVLWKEPRLEDAPSGRSLPGQGLLRSPVVEGIVRTLSVFVFLLVLTAGFTGSDSTALNIAPTFVYILFWVGLAFVHAFLGNWWATLSPWDSIARFLGIGERPRHEYPLALGTWPAAILLLGFLWLELVHPSGSDPRVVAWAAATYTVITLAGMAVFGRETWNRSGEAFAVYFRLLSLMAPLARDADGRVILRTPLRGLTDLEPRPGLVAFVMIVIGSTTFDGFSGTDLWERWTAGLSSWRLAEPLLGPAPDVAFPTLGLVATVGLASGAYALSMLGASAVAGLPWHPLATRFVHSLVPIGFAYVAAHYISYLLFEGQNGIALISDPFGVGWDLFGTASISINFALVSAAAIWYLQVAAIVLGHVAGVVLAHDRSLVSFRHGTAVKTQYALLAVMVLFTMGGLLVLSGG